ncbi:hypothetical protein RJT34_08777 [Clitoria ternatea]|uniref:Protein kinase domain-containing protein n=1 Tax=Clitoria ternatea TaxID=43366 RepID=A0AAN9K485_CLITE
MAPRILLCGNVLGRLNQLFKRVSSVLASKTKIYMASKDKLTEADGRKMFQQLIDGVSYCHNKGVSHKDVKVFSQSS